MEHTGNCHARSGEMEHTGDCAVKVKDWTGATLTAYRDGWYSQTTGQMQWVVYNDDVPLRHDDESEIMEARV